MIKSFKHKGLEKFFSENSQKGINPQHAKKLRFILALLNAATLPSDMNAPGLQLHSLKGGRKGQYAVSVSGNWRITFEFTNENVHAVNYEDYH